MMFSAAGALFGIFLLYYYVFYYKTHIFELFFMKDRGVMVRRVGGDRDAPEVPLAKTNNDLPGFRPRIRNHGK